MRVWLALVALSLAACGSEAGGGFPVRQVLAAQIAKMKAPKAGLAAAPVLPDAATLEAGRKALEDAGQPITAVTVVGLGFASFMVPLGENGPVVTWANPEYQTVALRQGVVVATRGFGQDLMSAEAPDVAVLRAANGNHKRVYYVLDGADQTRAITYDCGVTVSGSETISVVGKSYSTRKVVETCVGNGPKLQNTWWFDAKGLVRQSNQATVPGVENMQLQAIID